MRLPRVRIKVRGMILLVAAVALGLAIFEEFRDGLPPRFMIRIIASRINRLRPGMTRAQTREILGLDKSWWRGGVKVHHEMAQGNSRWIAENYQLRPFDWSVSTKGVVRPWAGLHLRFVHANFQGWGGARENDDRLADAHFSDGLGTRAEMPPSRLKAP